MTMSVRSSEFQADLFGGPLLPGLKQAANIITAVEEAQLIAQINRTALEPFKFQQWTGKRLTHSFGYSYDFGSGRLDRAAPIPSWLHPLRERAASFSGLASDQLVQVLLIRYDPGAGIGWHRDRPVYSDVIGISLGEAAIMRFRRRDGDRFERVNAPLEACGIYHMRGEARYEWEHSISEMEATRWSITFRAMAQR